MPTGSLRLWTHVPVTGLPGFAEGSWFVQDAAAALPARLLRVGPGTRVADFCAAPGGKAAQLAAAGAKVTAIDRSAERLKKLAANFARLNLRAGIVVADLVNFKTVPFDAICRSMRHVSPRGRSGVTRISPGSKNRAISWR